MDRFDEAGTYRDRSAGVVDLMDAAPDDLHEIVCKLSGFGWGGLSHGEQGWT